VVRRAARAGNEVKRAALASRGDKGLVRALHFLKNGGVFEGPGRGGVETPSGVFFNLRAGPGEEFRVVGAQREERAGFGARGEGVEQVGLHETPAVVALLRPGVGKEHEDGGEAHVGGQRGEGFGGVGFKEGEVAQGEAALFALGAVNALGAMVNSKTLFINVFRSVGGEEMAVAATDFEDEGGGARVELGEARGEAGLAGGVAGGNGGGEFDGAERHGAG
jgi:hypothetical protein